MQFIEYLSLFLDKISRFLLALFMSVLVSVVLFGVFNRFIFQFSYSWMDEAARYLMIWSCMLGSAIALRAGAHIGLAIIISQLGSSKFWLMLINNILVMVFLSAVAFFGMKLSISQMSRLSPTLQISMFWVLSSVPIGSFIMIIHSLSIVRKLFHKRKKSKDYL